MSSKTKRKKAIEEMLEPILNGLSGNLSTVLQGAAVNAYIQGDSETVTWGKTLGGIPIAYEGPPMQDAIKYAQKRGAELVTGMNSETKERLAELISKAIDQKAGIDGLSRAVKGEFENMSKYRSLLIARTETASALEQAFLNRSKQMGVTGKEWIVTVDCCDICEENHDAGAIPIGDSFPSGDDRPPAHPNCRCCLAPVMLPEKAEEKSETVSPANLEYVKSSFEIQTGRELPSNLPLSSNVAPRIQGGSEGYCYNNALTRYKDTGDEIAVGYLLGTTKAGQYRNVVSLHAWNINSKGQIIDTTLGSSLGKKMVYAGKKIDAKGFTSDKQVSDLAMKITGEKNLYVGSLYHESINLSNKEEVSNALHS